MAASMTNPVYTANLIKADGTKYRLKGATLDLVVSQGEDDLSEKVSISIANVKVGSKYLNTLISLKDKMYVYANTGSGAKEVFRGFVWEREFSDEADIREINLICYDRSIYLQKCKDNLFVKKGKKTKDIVTSIAKKWGFKIKYTYYSITHSKLTYHNQYIADILIEILEEVKKKKNKGYVIRFENNVLVIEPEGSNSTVYRIDKKKNAIATSYNQTMEGMITKVLIVKAEKVNKGDSKEETGKYLTVTSLKKNTDKYGTLQEIVEKSDDDKLSEIKKEANETLKEKGTPQVEVATEAIDNPWIKKGHKVYIAAGTVKNYYIVKSIEHDATRKRMYLEVEKA